MNKLWKKAREIMRKISIVDRFLMIFMLILFIFTIVEIITGVTASQDNNAIGVIVRTSLASIFGYFISSNFVGGSSPSPSQITSVQGENVPSESPNAGPSSLMKNQIGFETASSTETGGISLPEDSSSPTKRCSKTQVIVVASIGLISLFILIVTKQLPETASDLTAMKSQLRDFISASIGFLVSCGKQE